MDIQNIYESLSEQERRTFAQDNEEFLREYLDDANSTNLSGYSKEELMDAIAIAGADLSKILYGALQGGMDIDAAKDWLEQQTML